MRFVCRAVVDISPGEEVTTNYLYHQYHAFGNTYRAHELQDYWHFRCECQRWADNNQINIFEICSIDPSILVLDIRYYTSSRYL